MEERLIGIAGKRTVDEVKNKSGSVNFGKNTGKN